MTEAGAFLNELDYIMAGYMNKKVNNDFDI
jgi:hypothetical protein